jgi:hypothetical protein
MATMTRKRNREEVELARALGRGWSIAITCAGIVGGFAIAGCTQGSVTPGPVLACETGTGGAQPTEGGDHGAPWVPPGQSSAADETSTPLFDVGTMYDFGEPPPGLTDPTSWEIDPSGVHYRRATQNEITKNRWHEDVLLVAPPSTVVNALKNGSSTTTLHVPLADPPGWPQEDLAILSVAVSLRGSNNYSTFTEKRQNQNNTVTITRSRPTYRYYLQQGVDWSNFPDHVVQVFSSSRGGVVLEGATVDRSFWFDGPYSNRNGVITVDIQPASGRSVFLMYTKLEPPTSFATSAGPEAELGAGTPLQSGEPDLSLAAEVGPVAVGEHTCADGYDNDLLDGADGCDYACIAHPDFAGVEFPAPRLWEYRKTFVMFGDAMWCTQHESNWDIALVATGAEASQMLNWVDAPPEFGGTRVPPVLMVGQMCWPFKSITAAESCHFSSSCGGITDYPFKDVDNKWGVAGEVPTTKSFLSRVWGAKNIPNTADVWGAVEAWTAANTGANINQLHPVHMAAVITDLRDVNDPVFGPGKGGLSFSNAAMWRAGGAVVLGEEFLDDDPEDAGFKASARTVGIRVAHEFAHTLGIAHDDATIMTDIGTLTSFMSDSGGTAPILSEDTPSLVQNKSQYEAWTTSSPAKSVPRPAGFAYRGCTNNASCPAGLSCVQIDAGGKICL